MRENKKHFLFLLLLLVAFVLVLFFILFSSKLQFSYQALNAAQEDQNILRGSQFVSVGDGLGQVVNVVRGGGDQFPNESYYWLYIIALSQSCQREGGWLPWVFGGGSGSSLESKQLFASIFDVLYSFFNKTSKVFALQGGGFGPPVVDPPPDPIPIPAPAPSSRRDIITIGVGLQYCWGGSAPIRPFVDFLSRTGRRLLPMIIEVGGNLRYWPMEGTRDVAWLVKPVDSSAGAGLNMIIVRVDKSTPVKSSKRPGFFPTLKSVIPTPVDPQTFADPVGGSITIRFPFGKRDGGRYLAEFKERCALANEPLIENGVEYYKLSSLPNLKKYRMKDLPIGSKVYQNGKEVGVYVGNGKVLPSRYILQFYNAVAKQVPKPPIISR